MFRGVRPCSFVILHKFNQFLWLFKSFKLFNVCKVCIKTAYIKCEWFYSNSPYLLVSFKASAKLHLRCSSVFTLHYWLLKGVKSPVMRELYFNLRHCKPRIIRFLLSNFLNDEHIMNLTLILLCVLILLLYRLLWHTTLPKPQFEQLVEFSILSALF